MTNKFLVDDTTFNNQCEETKLIFGSAWQAASSLALMAIAHCNEHNGTIERLEKVLNILSESDMSSVRSTFKNAIFEMCGREYTVSRGVYTWTARDGEKWGAIKDKLPELYALFEVKGLKMFKGKGNKAPKKSELTTVTSVYDEYAQAITADMQALVELLGSDDQAVVTFREQLAEIKAKVHKTLEDTQARLKDKAEDIGLRKPSKGGEINVSSLTPEEKEALLKALAA